MYFLLLRKTSPKDTTILSKSGAAANSVWVIHIPHKNIILI